MNAPNVSPEQIEQMMKSADEKLAKKDFDHPLKAQEVVEAEPNYEDQETIPSPEESTEYHEEVHNEPEEENDDFIEEPIVKDKRNQSNVKMLREKAQRLERERDELLKHVLASQQPQQKQQNHKQEEPEEDFGFGDDDLIEGKHLRDIVKRQRELEKELRQYKQQSSQDTVEVKLKSKYPDFDKVVSPDNLSALREANPELAEVILSTGDVFKQASLAYQMVKQYGIYQEPVYNPSKQAAIKNVVKPRPSGTLSPQKGASALSQATKFSGPMTEEMRQQAYREMMDAANNAY